MGKRKTIETIREFQDGQLINETVTETEEDIADMPQYIPVGVSQEVLPKCSVCGADMVEIFDNTGWWSVLPKPRQFQCTNPNCPSKQTYITTNLKITT
jgi:hypothetical protein